MLGKIRLGDQLTVDSNIMKNHYHESYIIQGSKSHNSWNKNQDTEQKSKENTDDTILVITDTLSTQTNEGKCYCCGK